MLIAELNRTRKIGAEYEMTVPCVGSGNVREGQWGQAHDLLRGLFVASEHRGRDATGFAALTEPFDNPTGQRLVLSKEPIASKQFVASNLAFRRLAHHSWGSSLASIPGCTLHIEKTDAHEILKNLGNK